jgi:succinate dehydrogenase / fumarate reductase iron-sulfur subunit
VAKQKAELAMDAAACISCGACAAACKNASAMLFVAAKVSHLGLLPQGKAERHRRVLNMVKAMDEAGFAIARIPDLARPFVRRRLVSILSPG